MTCVQLNLTPKFPTARTRGDQPPLSTSIFLVPLPLACCALATLEAFGIDLYPSPVVDHFFQPARASKELLTGRYAD